MDYDFEAPAEPRAPQDQQQLDAMELGYAAYSAAMDLGERLQRLIADCRDAAELEQLSQMLHDVVDRAQARAADVDARIDALTNRQLELVTAA